MDLIVAGFGDVPILAKEATHIATRRAHAEDAGTGQEVIEGLFLDGVDLQGRWSAVTQAVEFAGFVDADEAKAGLARVDVAVSWAEEAMHAAVGFRLPPAGFVQRLRFLEDL